MTARRSQLRVSTWRGLFELVAVWGIAITQPMLNLLGTAPDFFISYRFEPGDVRLFVLLLALTVPIAVWLVELLLVRLPRARFSVHYFAIATFFSVFVAQFVKITIGLAGIAYVLVTVLVAIMVIAAYRRWQPVREWLTLLSIVPILASALFFLSTPAGRYARAAVKESTAAGTSTTPVVFLMLDEFPVLSLLDGKGNIDGGRFPNFARLASISNWYRNYSTTSEVTHMAVPSVMSGVYPKRGLGSTFVDHPDTLFTLLANSHEMNVWEPTTRLCPPTVCKKAPAAVATQGADWPGLFDGLRQLFKQRIDTTTENEMSIFTVGGTNDTSSTTTTTSVPPTSTTNGVTVPTNPATKRPVGDLGQGVREYILSQQTRNFNLWMDSLEDAAKPRLNFLHVFMPHQPWLFLPNGMSYEVSEPESQPNESEWEIRVKHQRHELQVRYVDSLIGRLLDRLKATGLLDKALLVVTADHGVSFRPGYQRRFITGDLANYPDIMHVPLFVHAPQQTVGKVLDDNVENVDVLPIVAAELDVTIPWRIDGVVPELKTPAQNASKTLFFVIDPFTAPKRKVPSLSIDLATFSSQTMTSGYTAIDPIGNQLQMLYDGVPGAELRFRQVSSFVVREGSLRFALDEGIRDQNPQVLVVGEVTGATTASDVFVFARDGVILGVSPVINRDGSTRVVSLLEPPRSPVESALTVYRVVNDGTLERVTIEN